MPVRLEKFNHKFNPVVPVRQGKFVNVIVEQKNIWASLWACCKKHWRQRDHLERALIDLPVDEDEQMDKDYQSYAEEFDCNRENVMEELDIFYGELKSKTYVANIWDKYNTDADDDIEETEMLELFRDGLTVYKDLYAQSELKHRWVKTIQPGFGINENMVKFAEWYITVRDQIYQGIMSNMAVEFIDYIRREMDEDGDETVNKVQFGKNLPVILESLVEWFNDSVMAWAEDRLGKLDLPEYGPPTINPVIAESAQDNINNKKIVLRYYWECLLYNLRQTEIAVSGLYGLEDGYVYEDVVRPLIYAQFRHLETKAMRYVWMAYKGDINVDGLTNEEFILIFQETATEWLEFSVNIVCQEWADTNEVTPQQAKRFKQTYSKVQRAEIEQKDYKQWCTKILQEGHYEADELMTSKDFQSHFRKHLLTFILDVYKKGRKSALKAIAAQKEKVKDKNTSK